jgi:predicted ATPase/DNA-binding SARP family transcriptional activator
MEVRMLGPLEVIADDGSIATPAGLKERVLLAVLALARGPVPGDRLVDVLWGEDPPGNPSNALQARVSALRRSLGRSDAVVLDPAGYALDVEPDQVDARQFEALTAEARRAAERGAPGQAIASFEKALSLWRGDALADFVYEDFALADIARLEDARLSAQEDRLQLLVDHGRAEEAVGVLETAVGRHPFRERLWALLMLALYRTGRQADALHAFGRARETLIEELGLDPGPELQALEASILEQDPSLVGSGAGTRQATSNVPARSTSFLGRAGEQAEVIDLVRDNRLTTLVGPGGVGKTSLAESVAQSLIDVFVDGVWFVELASLADSGLLADAVARTLGLRPVALHGSEEGPDPFDLLVEHTARRELLLVLDNCEHLIDACARLVNGLLRAAPGLSILATSREPLRVGGETVWVTPPLSAPHGEVDPARLEAFDSVTLFVERARAVRSDFELDAESAPAVSLICERLDGLPLAIELAATRVRALPVRELAARLHDRFRLLTGGARTALPRQQTLAATIDWSHGMLSREEQTLFRRLGVFAGGWELEAAEAVCAAPGLEAAAVLDTLTSLVDRSLVTVDAGHAEARYGMLETIREYARARLDESGEGPDIAIRHARHFRDWVEAVDLRGPEQTTWLKRLDRDVENLRAAMTAATAQGDCETALRLGGGLGWYWFFDRVHEGRERLDAILAGCPPEESWPRAAALQARAMIMFDMAPEPSARAAARESAGMFESLGDAVRAADAKCLVALDGWFGADPAEPLRLLAEARAVFVGQGDRWREALSEFIEMLVICKHDDLEGAVEHGRRALELFDETEDPWAAVAVPAHLGEILRWKGDHRAAIEVQTRALAGAEHSALPHLALYCLSELGQLAILIGDRPAALDWLERGLATAEEMGHGMWVAAFSQGLGDAVAPDDPTRARSLYAVAVEEARSVGVSAVKGLAGLAELLLDEGDEAAAGPLLRDGAREGARSGDPSGVVRCLLALGRLAGRAGDHATVAMLTGRAQAMGSTTGIAVEPGAELASHMDVARKHLGSPAYEKLQDRGAGATVEDLMEPGSG